MDITLIPNFEPLTPRPNRIVVMLTDDELEEINGICDETGQARSGFVRHCIRQVMDATKQ